MPLPKLSIPEYEMTLPVTGTEVTYRPFLVKEEKLLYLAMESKDNKQMIKAVKTIIKNCTNLKSKVEDLATFEIEYIFLRIRAKAVGETSEFKITLKRQPNCKRQLVQLPVVRQMGVVASAIDTAKLDIVSNRMVVSNRLLERYEQRLALDANMN